MTHPKPLSKKMIEELSRYVIASPSPFVIDLENSQGMWLATIDGDRLFDWAGYYGSKLIAHNHPRLFEPAYLKKLQLAANNKLANPEFLTPECLDFYRLIHSLAPTCMQNERLEVYAVNSGAEAVENMMKYFINLHHQKIDRLRLPYNQLPRVKRFMYFDQAYHGRTVFALNVTQIAHDPVATQDFHGLVPGNIQVPFPAFDSDQSAAENRERTQKSLDLIENALQRYGLEIIGMIVEPIQGAGGHRLAEKEFFQGLSRLAEKYQICLGFDEVQTAGGQTGTFFAVDQFDLPHPPQAIAVAKKMGTGAVYMLNPMDDRGVLDSTWGGTLADMVRFTQEMAIVRDEQLIEQVPKKEKVLVEVLKKLQGKFPHLVSNVRGLGLYQGFSLRQPEWKVRLQKTALELEQTILLGAATDTIRLRPNLNVTEEDILLLGRKLDSCLSMIEDP